MGAGVPRSDKSEKAENEVWDEDWCFKQLKSECEDEVEIRGAFNPVTEPDTNFLNTDSLIF